MLSLTPKIELAYNETCNVFLFTIPLNITQELATLSTEQVVNIFQF